MKLSKARAGAVLAASALVLVQAGLAAETQPAKFNAADQAAAKALTLKRTDFGPGWKGGARKPDLTVDESCPTKRSDLLVTGAARSEFEAQGAFVSSESFILRSAAMVGADWRRTIGSSAFMACARRQMLSEEGARLVSFKKLAFPRLTRYSARYRVVFDYGKAGSAALVLVDLIFLGRGRSEVTLTVTAPYADRAAVDGAGRRLAKLLVGRIVT